MKLSKESEKEVLQVYDTWLHSYLTGDVKTYDSYLDTEYHFIGSTNNEEFLPKKETTQFFEETAEQLAGKTELRNEIRILEEFEGLVFITHFFDAWFLNVEKWSYYGRFRFSSIARRNKEGWRFIYQHFSMPDSRAEEGETIGFDQVSAENLQLREAIKRRTIELENRNRDLEIERSLERVRTVSMSMQNSSELAKIGEVIFEELKSLGFSELRNTEIVINQEDKDELTSYYYSDYGVSGVINIEVMGNPVLEKWAVEMKKADDAFTEVHISENEMKEWRTYRDSLGYVPDPKLEKAKSLFYYSYSIGVGALSISAFKALAPEQLKLLQRFRNVFNLSYQRYVDIEKAEAQGREAQIEAALEKVRGRTMAMQKSEELPEAANNLFLQVQGLGIPAWSAGYCIWEEEDKKAALCSMSSEGELQKSFILPSIGEGYDFYHPAQKGDSFYVHELGGEALVEHYEFMRTLPTVGQILDDLISAGLSLPTFQIFHIVYFPHGYLMFITYEAVPHAHEIFKRFGKVFEQTYTRFLDLQKAEAQAREAQIESALERVRTRSMAMHKSEDLAGLSLELVKQVQALGVKTWFCAFNIYDEDGEGSLEWGSNGEGTFPKYRTPREGIFLRYYEEGQKGETLLINEISEGECAAHYEYLCSLPGVGEQLLKMKDAGIPFPTSQIDHVAYFKYGYILFITYEPSPESHDIFKRFARVFEQTYTRFLDLQQAEARARESQIETALERIRSRTMGMQKSDELSDVATVLFKELNRLVDNLWTCGFVLCEEGRDEDEWWLSAENGFIPAFYLPNVGDVTHNNIYNAWKNGADYHTEQLEGEALQEHYDWLMEIPVAKKIFDDMRAAGIAIPTWQKLHCAFFKTGYLVIITQVPCPEEEIFKRFAQAFDLTYTRFLDLQLKETQARKLAEDKEQLERTLKDLQATQAQLIQSEKMASLGELTAGIAHEIQNPLNFVNNFSEVSKELIEEMLEEIQKGDMEEAKALAEDVVQNLEKIHHHGQRADGIVKGMLQHSRSGSGEKEPTDLNVLADEYLRLAYHGLRAKDKSFNASLETHFDPNVGKVNVVAQDMGRVILNLITNAFYVVKEKSSIAKASEGGTYEPTVTVGTKKTEDGVEISVEDNGNGIPEAIKEKIFQPFFTTKPTGQGTGLGLSMSYDIVTKGHQGELLVTSEEGKGTTFTIVLPEGKKGEAEKQN